MVIYPLCYCWTARMPIMMSNAVNILVCVLGAHAHTLVLSGFHLGEELLIVLGHSVQKRNLRGYCRCRWFMETLFSGGTCKGREREEESQGKKPSQPVYLVGVHLSLTPGERHRSQPWRTFVTCNQPGIGHGPTPRGAHHAAGISG